MKSLKEHCGNCFDQLDLTGGEWSRYFIKIQLINERKK